MILKKFLSYIGPIFTSLLLTNSLDEIIKYMKKDGNRFMQQDSKENKMFSEMISN